MTRQWEPEWTIEKPLALKLIQNQFPHLHATRIQLLGNGWNNSAFVIDEHYIFRFPRRHVSLPMMEAEWQVLPKLAPLLPLPIPVPLWKGVATVDFPWPFIGYQMLPHLTACSINLSEEERASLAIPIARFLSQLHQTSPGILPENHPFADNLIRIDPEKLIPKILHNFSELEAIHLLPNRKHLESILKKIFRSPIATTVVHGDFYVRHILINEGKELAGVIDWGDIHLGDPAIDLAVAHSFLPPHSHDAFRKAYGDISEKTWELALLRSIYSNSLFALYGYHSQDPNMVRESLRSLA